MGIYTRTADEVFAVTDPGGNARAPSNADVLTWARETELAVGGSAQGAAAVFATRADALAAAGLAYPANTMAWVTADPTMANNGIYGKVGGVGTGTWTRRGDLPHQVIPLTMSGGPNAFTATTATPIPAQDRAALFPMVPTATNTGAVTIAINGAAAVPVRAANGDPLPAGTFISGTAYIGQQVGGQIRLLAGNTSINLSPVSVQSQSFVGNGSTVAYTLSWSPGAAANLFITVGATPQRPVSGDSPAGFTLSGSTITFTSPPPSGAVIYVQGLTAYQAGAVSDGAVGPSKLDLGAPGAFWTGVGATPPSIFKMRRLFVGDIASIAEGNNRATAGYPWLAWMPDEAAAVFASPNGRIGVTGLSRTALGGLAGDPLNGTGLENVIAAIGGAFGTINDRTNRSVPSWAIYGDIVRMPGTGDGFAMELDTANADTVVDYDGYAPTPPLNEYNIPSTFMGWTVGLWNMAGGSAAIFGAALPLSDASLAHFVGPNGARFRKGFYFHPSALTDMGGGLGLAHILQPLQQITWVRSNGGTPAAEEWAGWIRCSDWQNGSTPVGVELARNNLRLITDMVQMGRSTGSTFVLELGGGTSAEKTIALDLVAQSSVDYSARLQRGPGLDGTLQLLQSGGGVIDIIRGATTVFRINSANQVHLGIGDIATNRTTGFPVIPTVAGVPTGAPSTDANFAAVIYDSTNHRLYVRFGSWRSVALT